MVRRVLYHFRNHKPFLNEGSKILMAIKVILLKVMFIITAPIKDTATVQKFRANDYDAFC